MEIKRPKSIEEFLKLVGKYHSNGDNYYRGQADFSWDITPTLVRNRGIMDIDSLLPIENMLIKKFEQKIEENNLEFLIPKVEGYDHSWIISMISQHSGLPTRLLDFSHDKIIALLFAVADIQYLNKEGALIIYENPTAKQKDLSIFSNPYSNGYDESFFIPAPKLGKKENNEFRLSEIRKILQGSKFLYRDTRSLFSCLSKDQAHTDSLIKVHIPKELKLDILKEIIKMGEMVYDLFAGKNELDYYAAILKLHYSKLSDSNIAKFLKS